MDICHDSQPEQAARRAEALRHPRQHQVHGHVRALARRGLAAAPLVRDARRARRGVGRHGRASTSTRAAATSRRSYSRPSSSRPELTRAGPPPSAIFAVLDASSRAGCNRSRARSLLLRVSTPKRSFGHEDSVHSPSQPSPLLATSAAFADAPAPKVDAAATGAARRRRCSTELAAGMRDVLRAVTPEISLPHHRGASCRRSTARR